MDHQCFPLSEGPRREGVCPDCDMLPLGRLYVHEEYVGRRIAEAASPTMRR